VAPRVLPASPLLLPPSLESSPSSLPSSSSPSASSLQYEEPQQNCCLMRTGLWLKPRGKVGDRNDGKVVPLLLMLPSRLLPLLSWLLPSHWPGLVVGYARVLHGGPLVLSSIIMFFPFQVLLRLLMLRLLTTNGDDPAGRLRPASPQS
jgi:hypothetical protein